MAPGYCASIPCSQVQPFFPWPLAIGANTAIFQLLDAVRLRTLPVKNPQEIARVVFDRRGSRSGNFNTRYPDFTYAIWEQIRENQEGFSRIYAWAPMQFNISPAGEVHNVQGLFVSGEFFETLGVEARARPAAEHRGRSAFMRIGWSGPQLFLLAAGIWRAQEMCSTERSRSTGIPFRLLAWRRATFTEWRLDGTSTVAVPVLRRTAHQW